MASYAPNAGKASLSPAGRISVRGGPITGHTGPLAMAGVGGGAHRGTRSSVGQRGARRAGQLQQQPARARPLL